MGHIDDLYRQVWLHPDDDAVRRVLADALLAEGDPRGEFIQLQIDPRPGHEHRVMRLIQQHGLSWLGGLRRGVIPVAYERGFLASCVLYDSDVCAGREEWATVHTVEIMGAADPRILADPVLRSLRRIQELNPRAVSAFAGTRVEEIALLAHWRSLPAVLERAAGMPALRRIEMNDPDRLVLRTGRDGQLSTVEAYYHAELVSLLPRLPSLTELEVEGIPDEEADALEAVARRQPALRTLQLHRRFYNY